MRKTKQKQKQKQNKQKRVWRQPCECLSEAAAHLPPTVSQLLLQALFMQISGMSLHSPSPAGFVYLQFSWMHAPFVFSSIQPYLQLQSFCFI
jgi:hypothetical protein